ncbi:MAG: hypothetical protein U9N35_01855 [Euryarchaeota archaeon]|nr:hypothetical protein [Euryarchaeota archaeon]
MFGIALRRIKRFIFRKDKNFEDFAWLISVLDNYRAGKRVNRNLLRDRARNVHRRFPIPSLNKVYNDMEAIQNVAEEREPRMKFYGKLLLITQFLVKQALLVMFFAALIMFISFRFFLTEAQLHIIMYGIIAAAWVVVFVRWYVRDKTVRVYAKYQDVYKKNQLKIGEYVQELIDLMGKHLKERNEPAKKYSLLLYFKNYDNIKIKKNPGIFNEYYVCTVDLQSPKN